MLWILGDGPQSRRSSPTRREILRIGGLTALGLSSLDLDRLRAQAELGPPAAKYRQNSCVFIFLFGGPSHIDLWDMKPEAPAEIRGEFRPIATAVPGIQLCEHLPLLARADGQVLPAAVDDPPDAGPRPGVQRDVHRPALLRPADDRPGEARGLAVARLAGRPVRPPGRGLPPSVVLPWYTQFAGQDKPIAGQRAGGWGRSYQPFLVAGDPSRPGLPASPGLRLPDGRAAGPRRRRGDSAAASSRRPAARRSSRRRRPDRSDDNYATAFALLGNAEPARAFELDREPAAGPRALRRRQVRPEPAAGPPAGRGRRLAGDGQLRRRDARRQGLAVLGHAPPQLPHAQGPAGPRFDRAFSAFLEDLDERGLLETTLVVATGEFGRTPADRPVRPEQR